MAKNLDARMRRWNQLTPEGREIAYAYNALDPNGRQLAWFWIEAIGSISVRDEATEIISSAFLSEVANKRPELLSRAEKVLSSRQGAA